MTEFFRGLLNMSIAASCVIGVVLLVRLLLRRLPSKYRYWLWAVVGFRLCCPISFRSVFSLFQLPTLFGHKGAGALGTDVVGGGNALSGVGSGLESLVGGTSGQWVPKTVDLGLSFFERALSGTAVSGDSYWLTIAATIWFIAAAALVMYGVCRALGLRRRMETAICLEENIYQSDQVRSPFVFGIFRPHIYIPFGLDAGAQQCILEHERYHVLRCDPLVKTLAFLLLAVHWFNPLVWLAFLLMSRDMEMSCDEWVLEQASLEESSEIFRKTYSMTLLSLAANRRFAMPGPLAFGENDVASRIHNVLDWKAPQKWISAVAVILCMVVFVACMANPFREYHDAEEALEAYKLEVQKELETSKVTYFAAQQIQELLFVGCSYDGKLGVACFDYDKEHGWELNEVQGWYECLPRNYDRIRVTYHVQWGYDYMIVLSGNPDLAYLKFNGDYENTIEVNQVPAMIIVDYQSQQPPETTSWSISYDFFDKNGEPLT